MQVFDFASVLVYGDAQFSVRFTVEVWEWKGHASAPLREFADAAPTDLDELRASLQGIRADLPYGDWFRALAAIHHVTGGSEQGRQLAHIWSEDGGNYVDYDADEVDRLWDSLDPDHPAPCTMGTLRTLAQKYERGSRVDDPRWHQEAPYCDDDEVPPDDASGRCRQHGHFRRRRFGVR